MADKNIGKITQIIGAVLDIKFSEGRLPEINDAINITMNDGKKLVVEVSQHLGSIVFKKEKDFIALYAAFNPALSAS